LAKYDPTDFDLDVMAIQKRGLGRGRGFEVVDKYSLMGTDDPAFVLLKQRVSALYILLHGDKTQEWKIAFDKLKDDVVNLRIKIALLRDTNIRANTEIETLQSDKELLQGYISRLKASMSESQREVEVLRSEKELLESMVSRLRSSVAELQSEVEEYEEMSKEVDELLEKARELETMETAVAEILGKINAAYSTDYEYLDDAVDFLLEEGLQD